MLRSQGAMSSVAALVLTYGAYRSNSPLLYAGCNAIVSLSSNNISKDHRVFSVQRDHGGKQCSWLLSQEHLQCQFVCPEVPV